MATTYKVKSTLHPHAGEYTSCIILQPLHDPSWLNNVTRSSSVQAGSRLPT